MDNINGSKKLISVIMPAYNEEKYIAYAVRSIQSQIYQEWELLIVNDASSDGTGEIMDQFAKEDPRIQPIHFAENKGACMALNKALKMAKGDYICWLSADDAYYENFMQESLAYLIANPKFAAVFSKYDYMDAKSEKIGQWEADEDMYNISSDGRSREPYYRMVYIGNSFHACTVLAEASAFQKAGFFQANHPYAGDYDYMLRMAAYSNIGFLNKVTMKSRIHPEQVTCKGMNEVDAIRIFGDMLFQDGLRHSLFQKAGIKENRQNILGAVRTRIEMYQGQEPEATEIHKVYGKVIRKLPQIAKADAYCSDISKFINAQQWDKAEEMFYKMPAGMKEFADIEVWGILAAAILSHNGEYKAQREVLGNVLGYNPSNYEAHCMLGELFEREGKYLDALDSYRAAVKYSKNHPEDHAALLKSLERFESYLGQLL